MPPLPTGLELSFRGEGAAVCGKGDLPSDQLLSWAAGGGQDSCSVEPLGVQAPSLLQPPIPGLYAALLHVLHRASRSLPRQQNVEDTDRGPCNPEPIIPAMLPPQGRLGTIPTPHPRPCGSKLFPVAFPMALCCPSCRPPVGSLRPAWPEHRDVGCAGGRCPQAAFKLCLLEAGG